MKSVVCSAAIVIASPSHAAAHELEEVQVTKIAVQFGLVQLVVDGTDKGRTLSCAVYNADGAAIGQGLALTTPLATTVSLPEPDEAVASARCAFAD